MLEWLEASPLALLIRQSNWFYPILEIVHLTGIVLLAGAAFMFDFRLLGFSKTLPVATLAVHLLPWARRALFMLILPSGILLFITNATTLAGNPVFWMKMGLLLLAIVNSLLFHRFTLRTILKWNVNEPAPVAAKFAACMSIILWIAVISCGRLLAY
jgi:hypothetical protein